MPQGEILHLAWDQVDFKADLIRFQAEETKTHEKRVERLLLELTDLLRGLYKVRYFHEIYVCVVKG